MCGGSRPSAPAPVVQAAPPPPPPPPEPEPAKEAARPVSEEVQRSRQDERRVARAAAGRGGQIKTSPDLQDEEANKANRTVLG